MSITKLATPETRALINAVTTSQIEKRMNELMSKDDLESLNAVEMYHDILEQRGHILVAMRDGSFEVRLA